MPSFYGFLLPKAWVFVEFLHTNDLNLNHKINENNGWTCIYIYISLHLTACRKYCLEVDDICCT